MLRFAWLVLVVLFAPTAIYAVTAPGPSPYYCFVSAVCDGEGYCLSPTGVPTKFLAAQMHSLHGEAYLLEGFGGDTVEALLFDHIDEAKSFFNTANSNIGNYAIAIPREDIADGIGFIIHEVSLHANKREISRNATMVRCSSLSDGLY